MWTYPFMVNAFLAGTAASVLAAALGWFMVLRRQSFTGHTIAVVGFPGAAGATLLGVGAVYGYLTFCLAAAVAIAVLAPHRGPGRGEGQAAAVTGTVQAFLLGCGFLFASLHQGALSSINELLFGRFLGITRGQVVLLAIVAGVVLAALAVMGRPLLFASVDPEVAAGRGVPLRALSLLFLVMLGAATAEASQITGTLLIFALLVMPAAAAQQLTARPSAGLVLAVAIALAVTWLGLTAAYHSVYPVGFWVTTFAFTAYVLARGQGALRRGRRAARPTARSAT
ncbi:metal ABC transporter permease [Streptomyces sp. NPDC088254]|uniref:metal ABC transporter permease n=1 Tax=Streptomyces sp. NPDC088254 TaxID=3365847 RepID=UPI00380C01AE